MHNLKRHNIINAQNLYNKMKVYIEDRLNRMKKQKIHRRSMTWKKFCFGFTPWQQLHANATVT